MRIPRPPPASTPAPVPADDDDAALFRAAIGSVRELPATAPPPAAPKPPPLAAQRDADEREALSLSQRAPFAVEAADVLQYRRPEVAPRVLRRLRRGLYAVQDEIDLHQLAVEPAERVLGRFLREARDEGRLCVRVIHGKGLHSAAAGPVLKAMVERQLGQRREVLAYASAPDSQGGTGALLVLLARRPPGAAPLTRDDDPARGAC